MTGVQFGGVAVLVEPESEPPGLLGAQRTADRVPGAVAQPLEAVDEPAGAVPACLAGVRRVPVAASSRCARKSSGPSVTTPLLPDRYRRPTENVTRATGNAPSPIRRAPFEAETHSESQGRAVRIL